MRNRLLEVVGLVCLPVGFLAGRALRVLQSGLDAGLPELGGYITGVRTLFDDCRSGSRIGFLPALGSFTPLRIRFGTDSGFLACSHCMIDGLHCFWLEQFFRFANWPCFLLR